MTQAEQIKKLEKQTKDLEEKVAKQDKEIKALELKTELLMPKEFMKHNHSGGDYARVNMSDLTGTLTAHLVLEPKRFKLPATNYPSETFEGLYYTLDFDASTEESVYAQEIIPFRWAVGTDMEVEINWFHDTTDNGKVVWGVEYKAIKEGEAITGSGTTITQVSAGNHPADELISTTFEDKILGSNLEQGDLFAVRVFRDADNANDTLGEDARLLQVHFHFTIDKLGKK